MKSTGVFAIKQHSITVIIPAFNAQGCITSALDSVYFQTLKPTKLIVVNDGSTDATLDVVEAWYRNNSPSFQFEIIDQNNEGLAAARNTALHKSNTDLVALLNAEDWYFPQFLEVAHNAFAKIGNLDLFFANQRVVNSANRKTQEWLSQKEIINTKQRKVDEDLIEVGENLTTSLLKGNFIPCSASMLRLNKVSSVGYFNEYLKAGEDLDFFIRFLSKANVAFTYRELTNVMRSQVSITQSKWRFQNLNAARILSKYKNEFTAVGTDIEPYVNTRLQGCFYESSRYGMTELLYFKKQANAISFEVEPNIKDYVRACVMSLKYLLLKNNKIEPLSSASTKHTNHRKNYERPLLSKSTNLMESKL